MYVLEPAIPVDCGDHRILCQTVVYSLSPGPIAIPSCPFLCLTCITLRFFLFPFFRCTNFNCVIHNEPGSEPRLE